MQSEQLNSDMSRTQDNRSPSTVFCFAGNVAKGKVPLLPCKWQRDRCRESGHCVPSLIIFMTCILSGVPHLQTLNERPAENYFQRLNNLFEIIKTIIIHECVFTLTINHKDFF